MQFTFRKYTDNKGRPAMEVVQDSFFRNWLSQFQDDTVFTFEPVLDDGGWTLRMYRYYYSVIIATYIECMRGRGVHYDKVDADLALKEIFDMDVRVQGTASGVSVEAMPGQKHTSTKKHGREFIELCIMHIAMEFQIAVPPPETYFTIDSIIPEYDIKSPWEK